MKKIGIILMLTISLASFSSCNKTKYCQCYAFVNNEDIPLGEDYYMVEHGTCNDKAKEIVGWGNVTCREVEVETEEENWFWSLFNHNNNNHNNNNNNNNNNHGNYT